MWSLHRRGRGDMWDLNRDAPWLADSLRAHYEQRSFGGALFPRAAREKWSGTDPIRSQALTGRPIPAIAGKGIDRDPIDCILDGRQKPAAQILLLRFVVRSSRDHLGFCVRKEPDGLHASDA